LVIYGFFNSRPRKPSILRSRWTEGPPGSIKEAGLRPSGYAGKGLPQSIIKKSTVALSPAPVNFYSLIRVCLAHIPINPVMASRSKSASDRSAVATPGLRRLAVYGVPIEIDCKIPAFAPILGNLLGASLTHQGSSESPVIRGSILPHEQSEPARRLPAKARPLHRPGDLTEIHALDERAWFIDQRWGMCEINVLRGEWKSWILPQALFDPVRLADSVIYHPLAQILKNRGIHLLPALSVSRNYFAALILCPFGLDKELAVMLARGYQVIGQRWTCVRENAGNVELLHMPGLVCQKRESSTGTGSMHQWVDLTATNPNAGLTHAACNAVIVVDAGRRSQPAMRGWSTADASTVLRLSWPIPELHPQRRLGQGQLPLRLAQTFPCFQVQLSRDPSDLPSLIDSIRSSLVLPKVA